MKSKFLIGALVLTSLLVTSCTNKYENAIADYTQTLGKSKIDLDFKAKEIKEVRTITVGDSIAIYKAETDSMLTKVSARLAELREVNARHASMVAENTAKYPESAASGEKLLNASRVEIEAAEKDSVFFTEYLDVMTKKYEGRDSNDPLVVVVECKYSVINPLIAGTKIETTDNFLMSPDGKECYGRYENE